MQGKGLSPEWGTPKRTVGETFATNGSARTRAITRPHCAVGSRPGRVDVGGVRAGDNHPSVARTQDGCSSETSKRSQIGTDHHSRDRTGLEYRMIHVRSPVRLQPRPA